MNIDLTPRRLEIVLQKVNDGSHASVSEVLDEALLLLMLESEWKRQARQMILEGLEDFRDGRRIDGPRAVAEIRRNLARRRTPEKLE